MKELKKKIHYWCRDTLQDGLKGTGVTAAVLDTGIMPHPDLASRIVGWKDCVQGQEHLYDDNGHGTHVAGILAGDGRSRGGQYAGIAPGTSIVAVKVLDCRGSGKIAWVIQGIRYVLRERNRLNIRIVNISIGTLPHEADPEDEQLLYWVEKLWDAGMTVMAAAGNLGPGEESITLPGVSRKVITVGSCSTTVQQGSWQEEPVFYSGCGPTRDCIKKPDLSVPGNRIFSCNYLYPAKSAYPYVQKSGTSMSTPAAAGAAALLLEKYPDMGNLEIKLRFWNSCEDLGLAEAVQGHGRLHVGRLLEEPSEKL